jgi:acyl-CoA thioesterase-1
MIWSRPSRRTALAGAAALFAVPAAARDTRVCLLGDSIAAGYGLPAKEALPARLQQELSRQGVPARIVGAGVPGDTIAGGLRRLDRAAPKGVDACVVALGGNDLLNGTDPGAMRRNLDEIVRRLKARGVKVVLAGVRVPPILNGEYARRFNGVFAGVAKAHGIAFLPDLLAGVALNPRLNQPDGIHPNAAGVDLIAKRLAPLVVRALQAR